MWTTITAYVTANLAPILGSTLAGLALTWVLGKLTNSKTGGDILAKAMRQARRIGRAHSALGNSKLGPLWNPIETFGTTWIRSLLDEYFIGLREDNLDKLGEELERLEKSGSVKRSEAIRKRMEEVANRPDIPPGKTNAEVLAAAVAAGEATTKARLEQ